MLGKDTVAHRLRQREQMNVLMMADREMVDAELLSYRDNAGDEDCLHQMDDLQVNIPITTSSAVSESTEEPKCEKLLWRP